MALSAGYNHTFYISKAVYSDGTFTHTWSCSDGGAPLSFGFGMKGTPAGERVASNDFPTNQTPLDPDGYCMLNLADVLPSSMPDIGDRGNLTLTLVTNDNESTSDLVLYRMVYQGFDAQQNRATSGGIALEFAYEGTCARLNMFESGA